MKGRSTREGPGRPSRLSKRVAGAIVESVRRGNYLSVAAGAAGVCRQTVYNWLARGQEEPEGRFREFFGAVTRARAEHEIDVVAALHRAMTGYVETRTKVVQGPNGTVTVTEQIERFEPALALEFLARTDPQHWGRRDRVGLADAEGDVPTIHVITGYEDVEDLRRDGLVIESGTGGGAR